MGPVEPGAEGCFGSGAGGDQDDWRGDGDCEEKEYEYASKESPGFGFRLPGHRFQ